MAAKKGKKDTDQLNKELLDTLASRLKMFRKAKGFSNYEKFANQFNFSRSQMGKYEKGQNMNVTTLVALLRALEVPLKEFFSEGFDE